MSLHDSGRTALGRPVRIRSCARCGRSRLLDGSVCRDCGSDVFELREVELTGHVMAVTETRARCFAVVEVLDGIRVLATLPAGTGVAIGSVVDLETDRRGLFSIVVEEARR